MKQREWLNAEQAAAYAKCGAHSIINWWSKGLRGIKLKSRLRVGRRYTTAGAIERFFREVDEAGQAEREGRRQDAKKLRPPKCHTPEADLKFLRDRGIID